MQVSRSVTTEYCGSREICSYIPPPAWKKKKCGRLSSELTQQGNARKKHRKDGRKSSAEIDKEGEMCQRAICEKTFEATGLTAGGL